MNKEFLEEMRLEFNRRDMASESLTKKATNLMTIAGIISALLLGLYTTLLEQEKIIFSDWLHVIWFSIGLLMVSVGLCVVLNKVEFQKTPFLGKNFLNASNKVDLDILHSWIDSSKNDYYETLCTEYIYCLIEAESVIETKSRWLAISIILFLFGLVSAPVVLGISILF